MTIPLLDRLGDWNPQLLRELQGRLKPRNLVIAVGLAVISQIVILAIFWGQLPGPIKPTDLYVTTYPDIPQLVMANRPDGAEGTKERAAIISVLVPVEPTGPQPSVQLTPSKLQPGDYITQVDGVSVADIVKGREEYDQPNAILARLGGQMRGPLSDIEPKNQKREGVLGTTVSVRIFRPDVGYIDVQLPRLLVPSARDPYCTIAHLQQPDDPGNPDYPPYYYSDLPRCNPVSGTSRYEIDWSHWQQDLFITQAVFLTFWLLVPGVFLLVANLEKEDSQGTLNFVRLSPRSTATILGGKMLGVPSLLYVGAACIVPFHFWAGLGGQLPLSLILGFYGVLAMGCCFWYTLSLLYSVISTPLKGLQPWLGAGAMILPLIIGIPLLIERHLNFIEIEALTGKTLALFVPFAFLDGLMPTAAGIEGNNLQYFAFLGLLMIGNFSLWTAWSWQGLRRRFRQPTATLLSKRQSYGLSLCFAVCLLGLASATVDTSYDKPYTMFELMAMQMVFFLGLTAVLSPHRQTIQDWARYHHEYRHERRMERSRRSSRPSTGFWGMGADLLWGEKSPAIVAIMVTAVITTLIFAAWFLVWPTKVDQMGMLLSLLLNLGVILVLSAIAQLILLLKLPRRGIWAIVWVGGCIIIPFIAAVILSDVPVIWLLSAFPWGVMDGVNWTTGADWIPVMLQTLIGQAILLTTLNLLITRRLIRAGASASKALLSSSSPSRPSILTES